MESKQVEVKVKVKPPREKLAIELFMLEHGLAERDVMRRYVYVGGKKKHENRIGILVAIYMENRLYIGWCRRMKGDPNKWSVKRAEEIAIGRIERLMDGHKAPKENIPAKMKTALRRFIESAFHNFHLDADTVVVCDKIFSNWQVVPPALAESIADMSCVPR